DSVDGQLLAKCKRLHSTQLALAEMRNKESFFRGMARLFNDGSPTSQLLRPFYFLFHIARRNLVHPEWKKSAK
ncbi:MAG TPA: hypothetical protein VN620_08890, partial [Candidatus Methylomirabilis sp.]|nr:hypothetical protein [Candidatus Methylomirabilis sp.]